MGVPSIRLAPMAGITDWPFRLLCFEKGCDIAYTEMISAMGYLCAPPGNVASLNLQKTHPQEGPVIVQIFGKEPDLMGQAAGLLEQTGRYCGVDINMGCPAHKVTGSGEGSGLMRQPLLAGKIMETVRKNVYLPVTVKMRLGWNDQSINVMELSHIAQESGLDGVTVHGRTREQQYSGKADWDQIAKVKQSLKIPVYGNGDIFQSQDAMHMLAYTKCDGILIGRGAMGNPWIFEQVKCSLNGQEAILPSMAERVETALRHARMMVDWKGETFAVPEMRKHISWYIHGLRGAAQMRSQANKAKTMEELTQALLSWASMEGEVEEMTKRNAGFTKKNPLDSQTQEN